MFDQEITGSGAEKSPLEIHREELVAKSKKLSDLYRKDVNRWKDSLGDAVSDKERTQWHEERMASSWIEESLQRAGAYQVAEGKIDTPCTFIKSMNELMLRTTSGRSEEESLSPKEIAEMREDEMKHGIRAGISVEDILDGSGITRELYKKIGDAMFGNCESEDFSVSMAGLSRDIFEFGSGQLYTPYGGFVHEVVTVMKMNRPISANQVQTLFSEDPLDLYRYLDLCLNSIENAISSDETVSQMRNLIKDPQSEEVESEIIQVLGIVYRLRILHKKAKSAFEVSRSGDSRSPSDAKKEEAKKMIGEVVREFDYMSEEERTKVQERKGTGSNFARGVGLFWETWEKLFESDEHIAAEQLILLAKKMQKAIDGLSGTEEEIYKQEIAIQRSVWDSDLTEGQRREIQRAFRLDMSRQRVNGGVSVAINPQRSFSQALEEVVKILKK